MQLEDSKVCKRCGERKLLSEFSPREDGIKGRQSHCKECRRAYLRENADTINEKRRSQYALLDEEKKERLRAACRRYQKKHKERITKRNRERYRRMKAEILDFYGGECECCGERRWEFLAIDHVNGDGAQERRKMSPTCVFKKLHRHALKGERLDGYRILCHNCNMSYAFYGYCPHQTE